MLEFSEAADVSRVVPQKPDDGELVGTSLRVGAKLLARLDAIAKASGNSRTEVMIHILRWGVAEWEAEQRSEKSSK